MKGSARHVMVLLAVVVAVSVMACLFHVSATQGSRRAAEARGDTVVAAIEEYRIKYGEYPSSLAQLSPEIIDTVPIPPWGMRVWRYQRLPGDGYELRVDANPDGYPCLYFMSDNGWWSYDH